LTLPGKSEGYAIANGTAGYSGTIQSTAISTSAKNKIDGMVGGVTYLSGVSSINDGVSGYTEATGDAKISSDARSAGTTSLNGDKTNTASGITYKGEIKKGTGTLSTLDTSFMGGNANGQVIIGPAATATAWDQTAAIMDDSNARAKTSVNANSLTAIVKTSQPGDIAASNADMLMAAKTGTTKAVTTVVDTYASAQRLTASGVPVKMSAEAFINGGSWSALDRPTNSNMLIAAGSLGSYFNGMASGAHLISADAITTHSATSRVDFAQKATMTGTSALYSQTTKGPGTTVKPEDDAGSYFGTAGFATSAAGIPLSTSLASGYDINWINGAQTGVFNYGSGYALTENPAGSTTIAIARTPDTSLRTNYIQKDYSQGT
jgi:hypothetical protein